MTISARLFIAAPLVLAVLASTACTRVENQIDMPGTFTFDCRSGTDADCDAKAYEVCPQGYENAARINNGGRTETRAVRCK